MTDEWHSVKIGEFEHVAAGPSVALLRVRGKSSRRRQNPDQRPTLVADHGSGQQRFEALPSPPDPRGVLRAAYRVPPALLTPATSFSLDLGGGSSARLPSPSPAVGRLAPVATGATSPPPVEALSGGSPAADGTAQGEAQEIAALSAALAAARELAARLQSENERMAGTLNELEIWRGELERRLADTTTQLGEARRRLADNEAELERLRSDLVTAHAAGEPARAQAEAAPSPATAAPAPPDRSAGETTEIEALSARAEAEALDQAARELAEARLRAD